MEVQITDVLWEKTMFDDEGDPRREGLHLGTIINSIKENSGLAYRGEGFTDMQLTAEIGLLWELALSRIMREKYAVRPPQIQLDGIWISPDGVSFTDSVGSMSVALDPASDTPFVVEEYKCTWKSTKRNPTEDWTYMTQIKSYCHALGTTVAVLRVFYLMGDYKGSGPQYRIARIRFTSAELEDNWKMIVQHKEKYFSGR